MKEKFKTFKDRLDKIKFKYYLDKLIKLIKKNRQYIFIFISLYILDISTRISTNSINFVNYYELIPNLFTLLWLILLIYLVKYMKNIYAKLLYGIFYAISLVLFLVHNLYYTYFKTFFDFSILSATSEGSSYLLDTLKDISLWMYIVIFISILFCILTYKYFNRNKKNNYRFLGIGLLVFIIIHFLLPLTLGSPTTNLEWDAWSNKRNVYNLFNDNNKSMQLVGFFEYNIRNFYVNYIRDYNTVVNDSDSEDLTFLDEIFNEDLERKTNKYTGMFEGKNLILVQLESIDNFLVTSDIMPTLYSLKQSSINFLDHYSFVNGGGSTFNSEFMVNTGYATPYTYNQNAYTFSKNNFDYSLPNLFKKVGYTVNAFHMNSSEYYSRGVNYKNFGFDSYNGLKDLGIYKNKEYHLDRELLLNEEFKSKIFNSENVLNPNFVSYVISYSAHTPFQKDKGVCSMLLTDLEKEDKNYNPSEYECLKIQAKETDYMINLLIEGLKENGLYDNTVIVFFADHYLYTLNNKELLSQFKDIETNLINKTDFFIWSSNTEYTEVNKVTSQLNILPTLLNLFNLYDHPNYYIGTDALDDDYNGFVFFSDFSWYDGKRYVTADGEIVKGLNATVDYVQYMATNINKLIQKNDEVLKRNYFNKLKNI